MRKGKVRYAKHDFIVTHVSNLYFFETCFDIATPIPLYYTRLG